MRYITITAGDLDQNVYICYDENTKEAVVIDPGGEAARIEAAVLENGLTVKAIMLTHGHFDHIEAVPELKAKWDVPLVVHGAERVILGNAALNFTAGRARAMVLAPDVALADGETYAGLQTLHTPGHTPGGACYYGAEAGLLFAGDTLFYQEIGRTDLPLSDPEALVAAIRDKLFTLPPETVVLPGHGRASTIAHERQHNPHVKPEA